MQLTHALLPIALLLSPGASADTVPPTVLAPPREYYACPATNNGPGRNYPAHNYTSKQLTASRKTAESIMFEMGEKWQPGPQDYPHFFNNNEKLPFDCGKKKAEYPMNPTGKTWYPGDPVINLPDRAIFEYSWRSGKLTTRDCGIIRHGPTAAFLNCPN